MLKKHITTRQDERLWRGRDGQRIVRWIRECEADRRGRRHGVRFTVAASAGYGTRAKRERKEEKEATEREGECEATGGGQRKDNSERLASPNHGGDQGTDTLRHVKASL